MDEELRRIRSEEELADRVYGPLTPDRCPNGPNCAEWDCPFCSYEEDASC